VPTLPTPTTLIARSHRWKAVEQHAHVLGKRLAVAGQGFPVLRLHSRRLFLAEMKDQWRIVLDLRQRPVMFGELQENVFDSALLARFLEPPGDELPDLCRCFRFSASTRSRR
jgi:hypothetical protein